MELKKKYLDFKERILEVKLVSKIKDIYVKLSKTRYFSFIVFLYLVGIIMFISTLIRNNFTIPVSGDFTLQEIPFYFNGYDDWWKSITSGKFVMWDDSAMLGVNNIGANSFYYLFNPFFLILLLVPRSIMPQAQAFMMITKMVLAGLSMKLLLEKFKVKEETTWLVSLAYAFCGWNLYYLWFNHFLEIAVLMPLFLLGIEKVIKDQKPLMLILVIFISGLTNYFFLISFCFCGAFYAMFRYFQNLKYYKEINNYRKLNKIPQLVDVRFEVIVQGVFAFATGLMMASIILFPCFAVALNNTRVTSQTYLTRLTDAIHLFSSLPFSEALKGLNEVLFKWQNNQEKYLLYPLIAFFTPNVSCFDSIIIANSGYDNAYCSTYIYAPLLLLFIPSVINAFKKNCISTLIALAGIGLLMFTPFAYYCFSGFTSVAYARWYIFVTAICCVFIAVQYDKRDEMKIWSLDVSFGVILCIYGYLLYKSEYLIEVKMSNVKEMDERIFYTYGQIIYIFIMYLYLRKNYKKPEFTYNLRYAVALEAIVMCNITLLCQGIASYSNLYHGQKNISEEMEIASNINKVDKSYFRLFSSTADRNGNNLGMMLSTPGLGTFHSVYNYELEDFLDWSQVQYGGRNGWSMGIHEKRINLDEFVGVKYYLLKQGDNNVPFGFNEYLTTDSHVVYRNDNFIELGYAFDNIIVTPSYENRYESNQTLTYQGQLSSSSKETLINEKAYLTGAILYEEDAKELFGENYSDEKFNYITTKQDLLDGLYFTDNTLKDSMINVYYAEWHDQPTFIDKEENYTNRGAYSSSKTRNLTWFSYLDIDTSSLAIGEECSSRGKCFVSIQARMGENLDITLYGQKDGKEYVLNNDTHMKHYFSKNGDSKKQRGFYVDDKVTRIKIQVVETMNNNRYLLKPYITYEYEDTYNKQIAKLKENPLLNVTKDVNTFEFDTNFNQDKMVVLQIPYDQGWSLKDENEDIKIYKGQGGFVAFYGKQGNHHYVLKYETPYLKEGFKMMAIGVFLVSAMYIGQNYFYFNKKRYERMFSLKA